MSESFDVARVVLPSAVATFFMGTGEPSHQRAFEMRKRQ